MPTRLPVELSTHRTFYAKHWDGYWRRILLQSSFLCYFQDHRGRVSALSLFQTPLGQISSKLLIMGDNGTRSRGGKKGRLLFSATVLLGQCTWQVTSEHQPWVPASAALEASAALLAHQQWLWRNCSTHTSTTMWTWGHTISLLCP